ncbi:MAG: ThiF family adenylyltransferase, partial [Acidilobaceae archaeon]
HVSVKTVTARADERLLYELVGEADLALDCLDNWETRLALNKASVEHRKPLIHAGVRGLWGQLLVVVPEKTPCLSCIVPKPPREEERTPILGTTAGVMAMLQVAEAIKILTGYGKPALGKLIVYDGYNAEFSEIPVARSPNCPVCSPSARAKSL